MFFDVSAHADLRVVFCDEGASVYQIYYQDIPMLYVLDQESFRKPNSIYWGQFVCPFIGRIKDAKLGPFTFVPNEGTTCAHGSTIQFCWKKYEHEVLHYEDRILVRFWLKQDLFGGEATGVVEYALYRNAPRMTTKMSLSSTAPVPCNLTTHLYLNLGEPDVDSIELRLPASKRIEYDEKNIPLRFVPVEGQFDLREGKKLVEYFDHGFALDDSHIVARGERVQVDVETDAPCMVIYTDYPSRQKCGHSLGFTLECVRHPLMGEEMILPANVVETTTIDYTFSRR